MSAQENTSLADLTLVDSILHWHKLFESDTPPRLGLEVHQRLPSTALAAFSVGMGIGYSHGSKIAAYRFRAENAHRLPANSALWFQYHKSKSYASVIGGTIEGLKLGLRLGGAAFAFCLFEETVDYARHDRRDFLSTVIAGLSFSGIYSLLARHDIYTAARTTKLGLKLGLVYGLSQDALGTLRGTPPAYMDFFLGKNSSKSSSEGSI
ncbi:hypothetical protein ASPZODRAFT_56597 [Penicilliopsis zonata CBS 506.65]|uniref:Mitochondrial import inner membrane translocase subunit TIM22 n=1 Tax=Penicilliopsis zonata CBS 506.65 TaxID=1073090 RepID=A0A1L9SW11_9EURO|nr:hypothetical protein ASPZODRAFT_56597 [Penicilliopsis zonata CBS 506.65]OJJ51291.1 hypothetical protein ASPZODRAFT_56597 [Penicilliopsis zonata CBS 506.65]